MFNDRKLTAGHGFVKAYSNNWLSQLGSVYKYESPKDVVRKPSYQHRKIALYSILAMAFVAFFTLFMLVHEADRKSRQLLIETSFSNETAIEPSAGGFNTILTTPLSSGDMAAGSGTGSAEPSEGESVEHRAAREPPEERSKETAMKRTRRLRYYGATEMPVGRMKVGRESLVRLPDRYLKPPPPVPAPRDFFGRSVRRKWTSSEELPPVREDAAAAADRRRDGGLVPSNPKPFHFASSGPVPVGFQEQPKPAEPQPAPEQQSRGNRSLESIDWGPVSIQDIIRELTLAKRKQQQQFYYNHPYRPTSQPSEFNHPVHQNHRVKFTGIYRHPRKNGDITTVFGAASQRPQEVHLQAPQLINQQLGLLMPDRLYNFKPQNPSEVNLLATDQFRFAPLQPQQQQQDSQEWSSRWPKEGMPFSVMLNLEPMVIGGRLPVGQQQQQQAVYQQQQQQQQQQQRYRKRFRNRNPYRQSWGSAGNYGEQQFAQLSPYHHRSRPQNQLYRDAYGQGVGAVDDYEPENYFRKDGRAQPRVPAFASPLIGPGRLMLHFNIFPKQSAARRTELALDTATPESRLQPTSSVELNTGEQLAKDPASLGPTKPTGDESSEQFLRAPFTLQQSSLEGGRSLSAWRPSPTIPTTDWAANNTLQTTDRNISTTVEQPTRSPSPTVEVIKSIEIPTKINFDHVPLGRNPPPPLPPFSRWTAQDGTFR